MWPLAWSSHRVDTHSFARPGLQTFNAESGKHFLLHPRMKLTPLFDRYINTDYVFASSVVGDIEAGIKHVLVSYDIGCQWGVNLQKHLEAYGSPLYINLEELHRWRVAIPKFHLVGHGASCQIPFNLGLMDGVGLTHGEGVETIWSHSTSLATWSQENGPGARRLFLDDHWGSWNWRKTVNSGEPLAPHHHSAGFLNVSQADISGRCLRGPGNGASLNARLPRHLGRRFRRTRSASGRRWSMTTMLINQTQTHSRNWKLVCSPPPYHVFVRC